MEVVKNRYGPVGDEFIYMWDIDKGLFSFSRYGSHGNDNIRGSTDTSISRRNVVEEESPF